MLSFSPYMLKTFEQCPMKYYLMYIEHISVPQKASYFEKGQKIHALAHYYLSGNDISKFETALTASEKETWEKLRSNKYFNKGYVKSEYNLSCKVGDFWVGGRLDAIVKDENGYYILDYKTGEIPQNPEQDYQTMIYLLAASKFYSPLSFVYIGLKNDQNHVIKFDEKVKIEYEKAIIETCSKIAKLHQTPSSSSILLSAASDSGDRRCRSCDFIKVCK